MPVIYIDVLFFTNLIFDILLLISAGKLCCRNPGSFRVLIGGIIGAAIGVIIFFLPIGLFWSVALSVVTALLMITATFSPYTKSEFFRLISGFYLSSFLLSGSLSAIFFFSGNPAIMSNGICYFPLSLPKLIALAVPVAAVLYISLQKAKNRINLHQRYCAVTLSFSGNSIQLDGLIDTGCTLAHPSTGTPAIIVDFATAKKLCPPDYVYPNTLPFSTIHSSSGYIPSFTPDKCIIANDNLTFDCNCCVAVSSVNLNGKAIVNPELLLNWRHKYELSDTN